jgi:hypothetical protein
MQSLWVQHYPKKDTYLEETLRDILEDKWQQVTQHEVYRKTSKIGKYWK